MGSDTMRSVMLVFANPESASKVKGILISAGIPVGAVCSNGTAVMQQALLQPAGGVIVTPTRLPDMSIPDLLTRLPDTFDLLVLQSSGQRAHFDPLPGLTLMAQPLLESILIETVRNLLETRTPDGHRKPHGRTTAAPVSRRSAEETLLLKKAKAKLMAERRLTEEQAHRYLQKKSMETGTRILEIAQQVLEQGFI